MASLGEMKGRYAMAQWGQRPGECLSCAAADHAARGCNFAAEIMGNRVANFAVVELGFGRLQVALAERDGEQAFPTCIILAVEKWR